MEKLSVMQKELQQIKRELLCPKQVAKSLRGLKRIISTGSGEELRYNITLIWRTAKPQD